ncbi:glycosyltransferase family 2 protein [Chromohalobacter sp. HP20-39]|uniref:glycosyltransferase family 2 protein n=1 Tax=Chromohalobacter sp. HP20-39 TaxID=3079306 RepID=UPI00294B2B90|nr:glycosyltransferase family 2 protein [Chromohalobacter sp. HP20-39]MDV6317781.1 glycosyltransferase family 2 protein [Chromohalobacter sp. HP20-39]
MREDARACVIIPVYNHADAVERTCQALRRLDVPLLLVDDGCELACAAVLERLAETPHTHLLKLPYNQGKGAAVRAGLGEAQRLGFTHALQVDADGQHDADDLPPFLAGLDADDTTLRIGYPRFDASVPRHRFYARYLTHSLVWLNTLSFALRDTMCGVKLYPVAAVNRLVARHPCGDRMQFDTELPVRWIWAGHRVENLPVRVMYPLDGVSHFAMWRDNRQLTTMHLRLFVGMLWRLPRLLRRNARMTRSNG